MPLDLFYLKAVCNKKFCFALVFALASSAWEGCNFSEQEARKKLLQGRDNLDQKDYKAAVPLFSQALTLNPGSDSAYMGRAKAYYYLSRFDAAIVDIDSALRYNPDYTAAYYLRGKIRIERGDVIGACNDLEMARLRGHPKADSLQERHDCPKMLEP
jgi:tetratricopeptide (TPR) repeat protein